ncbi:GmrSD restriction endonuclease domain-containing protein [Catenovulum sediminis]|uniref:DUF1524 domain-containing protein n=1 Tax=Catenovulum sediminis TaxID=1740262 RepID=A0ABV1RHC6_9ALTE
MKNLLSLLIALAFFAHSEEYERSLYGGWIDADGDCQKTRQEVLISESLSPVIMDEKGCKVLSGTWYCPYTDRYFSDPALLDVDHLVPLAEAHRSGADKWDREKRRAFANDMEHEDALIAVYRGANRSKRDRDPADWMPENKRYWCEYIKDWVAVKTKWNLAYSAEERARINDLRADCK